MITKKILEDTAEYNYKKGYMDADEDHASISAIYLVFVYIVGTFFGALNGWNYVLFNSTFILLCILLMLLWIERSSR